VELAGEGVEQRPAVVRQRRLQPGRRIEGVGELEELARVEPASPRRPLDGRADVVRRADAGARPLAEELADLVGLVEGPGDDYRLVARLERFGEAPRRRERRRGGEALADLGELEQLERSRVHVAVQAGRGRVVRVGPDTL
jgi:hypothetical protein